MSKQLEVPRISQTEAAILAAIGSSEMYGLEIVDEVTGRGGRLSLGGVYTLLHRLETKGLVESRWGSGDDVREGARRRYYAVTALGGRALSATLRTLGASLNPAVAMGGN